MSMTRHWTNATYTHRPDHLAGAHRPPRAAASPAWCVRCGAVYFHKRWALRAPPRVHGLRAAATPDLTICPACRMAAGGGFRGKVQLGGAFLAAHRRDIEHLLENEARRAATVNPLGRIAAWLPRGPQSLTLWTTTEHLAQRLGRALYRAFRGAVHYEFSHENKFADVTWRRD